MKAPIRTRIKRRVGKPTAAVIFRTCRYFPSLRVMEIQLIGPCRASLGFLFSMGKYAALTALGTFIILNPKKAQANSPSNPGDGESPSPWFIGE